MTASASHRLTPAEIARFHEDGLVVPHYRLPEEAVAAMRRSLAHLIAANPHVGADVMYGPHIAWNPGQKMKGDPAWLDHAARPEILDMVEQLIGPDILLWGTTVFGKPAGTGKPVPWHQDGEYWPITPLRTLSVWIALDDCTPENGCLRFIAGSHRRNRLYPHHHDGDERLLIHEVIDAGSCDLAAVRDVPLRAGQMAMFDVFTVHGSHANVSARRRAGFVLRLMPTASHFDHWRADIQHKTALIDWSSRPLHLLRGVDRCGRNDFAIGH